MATLENLQQGTESSVKKNTLFTVAGSSFIGTAIEFYDFFE